VCAHELRRVGFEVDSASTAGDAIAVAPTSGWDAAVVDQSLPDMAGTDLVRALRARGLTVPFIIVSATLTTRTTVAAMRLGASEVFDKPVVLDDLRAALLRAIEQKVMARPGRPRANGSHSTVERWASSVVKACHADDDPRTLQDWARVAGMSYTSLRELCRILGIRAHDARDLARMLRAVRCARLERCLPEAFLDVGDTRTVHVLYARAGLTAMDRADSLSIEEFLARQRFVDIRHPAVQALRAKLSTADVA
jgi:ActR/RegA family two-component response regulator